MATPPTDPAVRIERPKTEPPSSTVSGYTRHEVWIKTSIDRHTAEIRDLATRLGKLEGRVGRDEDVGETTGKLGEAAGAVFRLGDAVRGKDPLDALKDHAANTNPAFWAAYQASLRAKVALSILAGVVIVAVVALLLLLW